MCGPGCVILQGQVLNAMRISAWHIRKCANPAEDGQSLLPASSVIFGSAGQKLNILLLLAADLGWSVLGWKGNMLHEIPNLDPLAR